MAMKQDSPLFRRRSLLVATVAGLEARRHGAVPNLRGSHACRLRRHPETM